MMDCKKALIECSGDMEKALIFLREKGLAAAAKRESRIAAEGIVESYIHGGGRIGVLVEVNCETDFVARSEDFRKFVRDIAMQIAAANPLFLRKEDVPEEVVKREKEILRVQALNEGKPEKIVDRMVEGRIEKYYQESCLMEQSFIRDPEMTICQLLNEKVAKIGEKIAIRRFTRYVLGEGIEKRQNDFAGEVMKEISK